MKEFLFIDKGAFFNIKASVNGDEILEIIATGDIEEPDSHELFMKEIIDVEKSSSVKKQLFDLRMLRGRLEILEIYNFVRDYFPDRPRMKIALVDNLENAPFASFYETTACNAGLSFKWFIDIGVARIWLKGNGRG